MQSRILVASLKNSIPSHARGHRGDDGERGRNGQCIQLRSIIIFLSASYTVLASAARQFHHFLIVRRRRDASLDGGKLKYSRAVYMLPPTNGSDEFRYSGRGVRMMISDRKWVTKVKRQLDDRSGCSNLSCHKEIERISPPRIALPAAPVALTSANSPLLQPVALCLSPSEPLRGPPPPLLHLLFPLTSPHLSSPSC